MIERYPWPPGFPDVVVHGPLAARDSHPDFAAAKSGDARAAIRVALDLLSEPAVAQLAAITADTDAVIVPITALETTGFNAIPDAMAGILGERLGLRVQSGVIVQSNRVGHTRAKGWHRLVTPAEFDGPVGVGRRHLLVDDHVGFGGTLANLRGHIEGRRGVVVAMTTLTETRDAHTIAVRAETLFMLRETHGSALETFWRDTFGHGLDCLTDVEAAYLARQRSVDAIRDRMAEAAEQARGANLQTVDLRRR
jgi:hypothetical protein